MPEIDESREPCCRDDRLLLLVSTTACVRDLARHLGSADYSYGFVWRALRPVLESLGDVRQVEAPESQLSHAAARGRAAGMRPVHLALLPPHLAYMPADVPTVLFPFWEFDRIPDRDFGLDTRQNWRRVSRAASTIVAACRFTAESFRRAAIDRPIEVIPVPLDPACFEVDPWSPQFVWSHECRHLVLGGLDSNAVDGMVAMPTQRSGWRRHLCARYDRSVRPWLSDRALQRARRLRKTMLRIPDLPPPLLPRRRLELSGLVYLSVFNFSDRRKNARDLLTAFLSTFRDRADVTLVLKLATNPLTEHDEVRQLQEMVRGFGISHRCRVIAITEYLEPRLLRDLYRVSAYYINTSRAEGACLPLQEGLASGRPAIAPDHTAMADYIDDRVGFPIRSSQEPAPWPHDPEQRSETTWARLSWTSLCDRLRESASAVAHERHRYDRMSQTARARMRDYAGRPLVEARWRRTLHRLAQQHATAA